MKVIVLMTPHICTDDAVTKSEICLPVPTQQSSAPIRLQPRRLCVLRLERGGRCAKMTGSWEVWPAVAAFDMPSIPIQVRCTVTAASHTICYAICYLSLTSKMEQRTRCFNGKRKKLKSFQVFYWTVQNCRVHCTSGPLKPPTATMSPPCGPNGVQCSSNYTILMILWKETNPKSCLIQPFTILMYL